MLTTRLATGGAGTPVVGSNSGGFITVGVVDKRTSVLPVVLLIAVEPASDSPIDVSAPSTVTSERPRPWAFAAVRSATPPPTVENPTCCGEDELPQFA